MSIIISVAVYIIDQGKINIPGIIKEVPGVENYNRAAEIIEDLEKAGIIGKFNGYAPREILIDDIKQAKKLLIQTKQ